MLRRLTALLLLAVALPASAAGSHLEPGTLVSDGGPDQAVMTRLYVKSGFKDAQSVYVVRPVVRCRDPSGPVTFPPFGSPSATQATDSGSLDDGVDRLVNESFRLPVAGA